MDWIVALAIFGTVVAIFDVYWVIRLFLVKLLSLFRKKQSVNEEFFIYGICSTTDIDIFIHMNNGKYFRELDFARFDFYFRTGLCSLFWGGSLYSVFGNRNQEKKVYVVQHGAMIRFRRSLDFLMPFVVKTKLVYFDQKALYFEQSFISKPDNFVRAVALCKNAVVNCPDLIGFFKKTYDFDQPECPPDLARFIEANEISSNKLRMELQNESTKTD